MHNSIKGQVHNKYKYSQLEPISPFHMWEPGTPLQYAPGVLYNEGGFLSKHG